MSSVSNQPSASKVSPREAALLAAQARLDLPSSTSLSDQPSASSPQKTWIQDDKSDRDYKFKLTRIVDKEIMGGNRYVVAAGCIETLLQITSNILSNPTDPKFQRIKATSSVLKNKVLGAKGGEDMLRALGFRSKVIDFIQQYHFMSSEEKLHNLELGKEVLEGHLEESRNRASSSITSHSLHQTEEQSRKAEALRSIEDDREKVRDRVEREKRLRDRERRERSERERLERQGGGVGDSGLAGAGMGAGAFGAGAGGHEEFQEGINDWDEHTDGDDDDDDEVHGLGGRRLGD